MSDTARKPDAASFHPIPSDSWLAQWQEPVIEPELPIIDPHHHLWQRPNWRYARAELLADLDDGHAVVSTVFVQCREHYRSEGPEALRPLGETEFVVGIAEAAQSPARRVCEGIVGFADLALGDAVRPVLAAQLEAGKGRLRGIRQSAARDPDPAYARTMPMAPPGLLVDAAFQQGFACLSEHGLGFDVWVYHPQLPEVLALARAFPETPIVLDHVGGPLGLGGYAKRRDAEFHRWRDAISELASSPNVSVKLGGLGMAGCGFGLHERDRPPGSEALAQLWRPWIDHCIAAFGPSRCMFESNFPVDRATCSYRVLWNAFKRLAADLPAADRRDLFAGTAARIYRLQTPGAQFHG